jgi:hypothetical protein
VKGTGRFPRLLALSVMALVAACGGGGSDDDDDDGTTNPPPPPATATGYLFVAAGGSITAFTQAQTGTSSTVFPALTLQHNLGHTLGDVALDRNGNVWAVGVGSNTVVRFRSTNIPGVVTPDLTISSTDLNRPWGLAFDSLGNLYVSNSAGGGNGYTSIIRFNNVIGLTGNQTLSASLVIRPPTGGAVREYYSLVHGLAFSATGELYAGGPSTILRFIDPLNRTGTITPTPDAVLIRDGYGPQFGWSGTLAFDATGALWATGCQGLPCVDFVMKFSNPVFAGVVSPSPNQRLTLGSGRQANGMAFDAAGDLWMIWDGLGRGIVRIANPGSLGGTATATAATTLNNTSLSGNSKLAFFPTPLALPIY